MKIAYFLFMEILNGLLREFLNFYQEISIYLLLGMLVAAFLYVLFPPELVRKHLGKSSFGSVIKSTLLGIPIPLCSCGVIPVAAAMRKNGASKGAAISFMISTPQVGADSFLLTYSLLGWIFALFRVIAAFFTGLLVGIGVNILDKNKNNNSAENNESVPVYESRLSRLKRVPEYIEFEVLGPIANTLLLGIVIASLISYFVPPIIFTK